MKRSFESALLVWLLLLGSVAQSQESETAQPAEPLAAAVTMVKMMDPNTWFQLMAMSMDPRIWMNPISSCAACHDNEDVGRYQQVFGPFMSAMTNPAMWADPATYNTVLASTMDARAAEEWTRALTRKYGMCDPGGAGCPPPTTHSTYWWPWPAPAVPTPSAPASAQQ